MASKKTNLCTKCNAMCCRYVALPLDTPEDRNDYDDIRWYLTHQNVSVFVEKGDWYVNFSTSCKHIDKDSRCSIYEKRPKICRKYTTDTCDRTSDEYDYELHFTSDEQMAEYIKVKFDNMKVSSGPEKKKAKARGKSTPKKQSKAK